MAEDPNKKLKVATIFSSSPDESVNADFGETDDFAMKDENNETAEKLKEPDRNFLAQVIEDYNGIAGIGDTCSLQDFQGYYESVSKNMKERNLDVLIVVNMFLTGFDAPTLNTLWVDRNLKKHGLIQAFSRTNRLCNGKQSGQIFCFRPLANQVDEALALFSKSDPQTNAVAGSVFCTPDFETLYFGKENGVYADDKGEHDSYKNLVEKLKKYPLEIASEKEQVAFVRLYGEFLRMHELLSHLVKFKEEPPLISPAEISDYHGLYLLLHDKIAEQRKAQAPNKVSIVDDLLFEIELIKKTEINVDYLLELLEKNKEKTPQEKKEFSAEIERMVRASPSLRSKRKLIQEFMEYLNSLLFPYKSAEEWEKFVRERYARDLAQTIKKHELNIDGTHKILNKAFDAGELKTVGKDFDNILPKIGFLNPKRAEIKMKVIEDLQTLFERYSNTNVTLETSPAQNT